MTKKLKTRMSSALSSALNAFPWIMKNKKKLIALLLTFAASIITPSVVDNVDVDGHNRG